MTGKKLCPQKQCHQTSVVPQLMISLQLNNNETDINKLTTIITQGVVIFIRVITLKIIISIDR